MSTGYGAGRSGIPAVTLIIFVIVALVGIWVAFHFYTQKEQVDWKLKDAVAEDKALQVKLGEKIDQRRDLMTYLDPARKVPKDILDYYATLDLSGVTVVPPVNFVKLAAVYQGELMRYQRFIRELDQSIQGAANRANIAEAEATEKQRHYDAQKLAKATQLADMERLRQTRLREKEERVSQFVADKKEFDDKYLEARNAAQTLKSDTLRDIEQLRQQNNTDRAQLRVLRPEASLPRPVGKVLSADWEARQGVVNIGSKDGVFAGLALEAFMYGMQGERIVKAKFEVFRVGKDTSVVTITEINKEHPVIADDPVSAPFVPAADRRFVIAGVVPASAEYNREQLAGLIQLNGGVVQDQVDLMTDMLVLGDTATKAGDQETVAAGRTEMQRAKELSIDVVDWRDFMDYIRK